MNKEYFGEQGRQTKVINMWGGDTIVVSKEHSKNSIKFCVHIDPNLDGFVWF